MKFVCMYLLNQFSDRLQNSTVRKEIYFVKKHFQKPERELVCVISAV